MKIEKITTLVAVSVILLNLFAFVFWFGPETFVWLSQKVYQTKSESVKLPIWKFKNSRFIDLGDEPVPTEGKALLADLDREKIFLYEDGSLVGQFPILSVGKAGTPWETPGGDFSILLKKENHFSSIGSVWMPFSLQFLGNYFIHGWPYYANNVPVPVGYSGGCIRLSTPDAEKVYRFVDRGSLLQVVKGGEVVKTNFSSSAQGYVQGVGAKSYLVADLESGEVILEKSAGVGRSIYTLSKLMSALVALDQIDPFASVKVSASAVAAPGNAGNLRQGEVMEVRHLIYPLLLEGSNDANQAIVEKIGVKRFLSEMNKRAGSISLKSTHFAEVLGQEAEGVSTAEDIFRLVRHLNYNKKYLLNVSRLERFDCCGHRWTNDNPFAGDDSFAGGYGEKLANGEDVFAGIFSLPVNDEQARKFVFVVLGSPDFEKDVSLLLEQTKKILTPISKRGEVILLAVGDIMLDRGVEQLVNKRGNGDFSFVFENIEDLKGEADILLGNLEGPVSDQGADIGNLYSFRMSPAVLPVLKKVGFDILTVANNHAGDWGLAAFVDSLKRLAASEFSYVGGGLNKAEAEKLVIIEKNGLRVGFLGFSDVGPKWLEATEQGAGILNVDDATFAEIIARAAKQSDALVVTIHFGEEYQKVHNDRQEKLAKTALEAGAMAVIGHHPHVIQDDEQTSNQYIAYSLGNFVFDQNFSAETMAGLALKLKLSKDGVVGVEKLPVKINESFQPSFK